MRACVSALMLAVVAGCTTTQTKEGVMSDFTSTTVSFGIVVSDVNKAAEFYKNGLGFTEVKGFDVPKEVAGDSGLSDYAPFHVRVLVLGEAPGATKVKLMAFPDAPGAKVDNAFIHSSLGVSYLTVLVSDMTAAVERAAKAGAAPLAKGPVLLPKDLADGIYLTLIKDPDGNIIELVGPKKK